MARKKGTLADELKSEKYAMVCSMCGKRAPRGVAFTNAICGYCGGDLVAKKDDTPPPVPARIKRPKSTGLRSLKDCLIEAGNVVETMLDEDGMPFDISKNEIAAQLIIEEAMPMDTDPDSPTFGQRMIGDRRLLELWISTTAPKDGGTGRNELEDALNELADKLTARKNAEAVPECETAKPGEVTFEAE